MSVVGIINRSWDVLGPNNSLGGKISLSARTGENIIFNCFREIDTIDERIASVYQNIINCNAHRDIAPNNGGCAHGAVTGPCGNMRKKLSECRCEALNRKTHPDIRREYENCVIAVVMKSVRKTSGKFHFKLAVFASGHLLGEQILLFRLLDQLKKEKKSGVIDLFFIDHCYRPAISKSDKNILGREGSIEQFLVEITQALPKNIAVSGGFFDDAQKYIALARKNKNFQHNLLIGADIEGLNKIMGDIGTGAGTGEHEPITLIKRDLGANSTRPEVCKLDSDGELDQCYDPRINQRGVLQQESGPDWGRIALFGLLVLGAGTIGGMAYKSSKNK
ncbi:MAG: hypothetical protein QRY74_06545 [Chlamydia sp.]